ncbi:MAG: hypothetical protein ACNYPI_08875 [Arenicellales bacterium WSBS_2016_MAG_OTU3]
MDFFSRHVADDEETFAVGMADVVTVTSPINIPRSFSMGDSAIRQLG